MGRDFHRDRPDQLWIGDLTYVPTDEGWLFVTSVIDAVTRRLLGGSVTDHVRAEVFCDALRAAAATRRPVRFDGLVFHSDHGSLSSTLLTIAGRCAGICTSLSPWAVSVILYDNARAESFWTSLKRELVDHAHYKTKLEARTALFEWLVWYNRERLHSSIGYRPPEEYEHYLVTEAAA